MSVAPSLLRITLAPSSLCARRTSTVPQIPSPRTSLPRHLRCLSSRSTTSHNPILLRSCRRTQQTQWNNSTRSGRSSRAIKSQDCGNTRRQFTTSPIHQHGHYDPPKPGEERHITFLDKDSESHTFVVPDGANLLDIAQANELEMEGACGGSCACSTCHVIISDEEYYNKMAEPEDDENDMLDLAFGLTETSRLGCQVEMRKELDGMVVRLPSMTRNLQASDFEEKKK